MWLKIIYNTTEKKIRKLFFHAYYKEITKSENIYFHGRNVHVNTIITLTPYSDILLHIIAATFSREWLEYFPPLASSSILFAELLEFESVGTCSKQATEAGDAIRKQDQESNYKAHLPQGLGVKQAGVLSGRMMLVM